MIPLRNLPYVTGMTILLALAVYTTSGATELFMYHRGAFIEGDWWRPATSWVTHFSASHLFWNLLTLSIVGLLVEQGRRQATVVLVLLSAVLHYALLLCPEVEYYAGISGFTIAMLTLYICDKIALVKTSSKLWPILLLLIVIKISVEQFTMQNLFATGNFRPLPVVHLAGLLAALAIFGLTAQKKSPTANRGALFKFKHKNSA